MFRENFFQNLKSDTEAIFDVNSNQSSSYQNLAEKISDIVEYLKSKGLKPQSKVAIFANHGLETTMLYLACLQSRIIICPINPKASDDEKQYCLNLVKPDLVLENYEDLIFTRQGGKLEDVEYQPDDIYTITFTSGSTGNPKAIMHKAEILLSNADAMNKFVGSNNASRFFHVMPIYYMAGILNSILCPIVASGTVVIAENFGAFTPITFWKKWLQANANTTWISPTMAIALIKMDRDEEALQEVKKQAESYTIFCGTGPLNLDVKKQFKEKYNIDLIESYGLSEILFVSAKDRNNNTYNKSVGKLIEGVELNISDSGELEFVTDYPMIGYLNEDGSSFGIKGNKFASGDLGEIKNGELFITGRAKDLIIKGGINISPSQIEEKIAELEGVEQVAIIGYEDEFYGENIACFYAGSVDENTLQDYCRKSLEDNKIPAKFKKLDELPFGPTGKIQKSKLVVK